MAAKFIIKDTFIITGRGIVLAGYLEDGSVQVGDFIGFQALDNLYKRKIIGINGAMQADGKRSDTGLLIQCENENEINALKAWKADGSFGAIYKED